MSEIKDEPRRSADLHGPWSSNRLAAMTATAFLTARFTRKGDTVQAEFRLTLDHHQNEVWAALTEPQRLAQWLAPGAIALRVGGAARLDFPESGGVIDSVVTALEPGRLLEYSWSSPGEPLRLLRWELEPLGAATLLTLRLSVPAIEDVARATAGWAAHLEMLQTALFGVATRFPFEVFKAARDSYRAQLAQAAEHTGERV
ncbi:MAG TPA: SRPBCC family protein [Phenylobacterium sp.]|nr:SRPBCC family protein [Phenylobacterium sp.]